MLLLFTNFRMLPRMTSLFFITYMQEITFENINAYQTSILSLPPDSIPKENTRKWQLLPLENKIIEIILPVSDLELKAEVEFQMEELHTRLPCLGLRTNKIIFAVREEI